MFQLPSLLSLNTNLGRDWVAKVVVVEGSASCLPTHSLETPYMLYWPDTGLEDAEK